MLEPSPWKATLSGAGFTIALLAWLRARRHHCLEPFIPSGEPTPISFLERDERRALRSQLRGARPVTPRAVALITLLTHRQEASSRNTWPTLIGVGLAVLGANVDSVWVVSITAGACVVVAAAHWFEQRRWRRVHAVIARASEATADASTDSASRRSAVSE